MTEREQIISDFQKFLGRLNNAAWGTNRCSMHVWASDVAVLERVMELIDAPLADEAVSG